MVTPAVDFALTLPEVDPSRLALIGMSLGGYLAARAAAFEHRLAACVLYDGVCNAHAMVDGLQREAAGLPAGVGEVMAHSTGARWLIRNGRWTFGVSDADELFKAFEAYTMEGIADRVTCPTLVLEAENDQFFAGQPRRIFDALTCPKELITFPGTRAAASTATRARWPCSTSAPSTGWTPCSPRERPAPEPSAGCPWTSGRR